MVHWQNLETILLRNGMNGSNHAPDDGLSYRTIHNEEIQSTRHARKIPCAPHGTLHDYVPFYFGYLSPMLFQLSTGRVSGYNEDQESIVYVVSTVEDVVASKLLYVFSEGHGIAKFTQWFNDVSELKQVDWKTVYQRYWADTITDMDRQRRKQAEFLVYKFCPWSVIKEIGVKNQEMKNNIEVILSNHPEQLRVPVRITSDWYY
jgi:hypothetical protein